MQEDENSVFINDDNLKKVKFPQFWFILFKLLPLWFFSYINKIQTKSTASFIIYIITIYMDFFTTKNIAGPELVGLGWFISTELESNSLIQFLTKPFPFVPNSTNSNLFWGVFLISCGAWVSFTIFSMIQRSFYYFFLSLVGLINQVFNIILFMKAHNLLQIETANIARAGIMGNSDPLCLSVFKKHNEDDSSSQDALNV